MQVFIISLLIIIILIICQLFFIIWHPLLPAKLEKSTFFYYGHRGAPSIAPENTITSFQAAINNNMDGIELDVQLTKDNYLVVYHDQAIKYKNELTKINTLSLDQIQAIDVKNKFEDMPFHNIPLLEDVIKILPDEIILNIEIKSYDNNVFNNLEKILMELIAKHSIEDKIIISSFNPFIIKKIKALNTSIATAFIWSSKSYYAYKLSLYYSKPDAFHININDINQSMIQWVKKRNLQVYAYTVNSTEDLEKAQKYGLDGIFTDNPTIKS